MYAVVETGGKQYKVSKGDLIKVEKVRSARRSNWTGSS
jgi:ribosomal protein L21